MINILHQHHRKLKDFQKRFETLLKDKQEMTKKNLTKASLQQYILEVEYLFDAFKGNIKKLNKHTLLLVKNEQNKAEAQKLTKLIDSL